MAEVIELGDDCTLHIGANGPLSRNVDSVIFDEEGNRLFGCAGRLNKYEANLWLQGYRRGNALGYDQGITNERARVSGILRDLVNGS